MSWKSIADMIVQSGDAQIALVGAPMEAGSVTPGRCDLAPEIVRKTLRRFSTYDVETGKELDLRILDAGDADVRGVMPAEGFAPKIGRAHDRTPVTNAPTQCRLLIEKKKKH